jgi:hypothetical protein
VPGYDHAYYEEIAGGLRGLLIRFGDRLSSQDATLIAEFIDANELGLALEQMADVLCQDDQPLSADERTDMLALVDRMQMDDRVSTALALCPDR